MAWQPDDEIPESIRDYLDSGGELTALPGWELLADVVTFGRRANLRDVELRRARRIVADLEQSTTPPVDASPSRDDHGTGATDR